MRPIVFTLAGLVLAAALASPSYAQSTRKYHDKATFLAETAATGATGPLPNVGIVLDVAVDPLGTYTLGSLTFSLSAGSDNVAVGAAGTAAEPDWYPQTPGNDMAFGWERFQVSTPGPVYSFGFDIVEPDATMPPFGGTPEESTYEFLLFNGAAFVGRVEFAGTAIPNDVETFIGVWSSQPFDRVVINDIAGSDDDEFVGEFYTGTTPLGCTMNLDLTWSAGTFTMNIELGTSVPRTWNLWFVFGESSLIPLWSIPLPAFSPAVSIPMSFTLPPIGAVGMLSTLASAGEGIACSDFKTVSPTP